MQQSLNRLLGFLYLSDLYIINTETFIWCLYVNFETSIIIFFWYDSNPLVLLSLAIKSIMHECQRF